jgi:GTP-binding protein Era
MTEIFRSGYVAIVGPPNVGKSTLLNRLMGQKIAIVTPKPQTTRNRLLGILTRPGAQMIFVDTPGIFRPGYPLQKAMVETAVRSLGEADLALAMIDAAEGPHDAGDRILRMLSDGGIDAVLALNKVDMVRDKKRLLPLIDRYHRTGLFREIVPISALTGDGVDDLLETLSGLLPEGPQYYPEEMITESPERFLAAEVIREKVFLRTGQEIPYAAAVKVDEYKDRGDSLSIKATIYLERDSQKAILIGQKGAKLKEIGQLARLDLEAQTDRRIFLDLWVKVRRRWRHQSGDLRFFGYDTRGTG